MADVPHFNAALTAGVDVARGVTDGDGAHHLPVAQGIDLASVARDARADQRVRRERHGLHLPVGTHVKGISSGTGGMAASCGGNGEMRLNKGGGTPTVSLQGCPTGWGGGRGRGCGDEGRIPPRPTGRMSNSNAEQTNSRHLVSTYHLRASVSGHRGGGGNRAHLRGNVVEAAVGSAGAAQLAVYARVSYHSERVGVRAGHRQRRAEARGCNAERRPLPPPAVSPWLRGFGRLTQRLHPRRFTGCGPQGGGAAGCRDIGVRRGRAGLGHRRRGLFILKTQTSGINPRGGSCPGRSEVSDSPGWSLWTWWTACCWTRPRTTDSEGRPSSPRDACPGRSPGGSGRGFLWGRRGPAVDARRPDVNKRASHGVGVANARLRTSLETSTTRLSSLFSPSLSCVSGNKTSVGWI